MKTTRLNRSVARRLDWGLARASRLALDAVSDGSVTQALRSLGLLFVLEDESLLDMRS